MVSRELVLDPESSPSPEGFLGHCHLNLSPSGGDTAALGSFLLKLLHFSLSLKNDVSSALG